MYIFAKSNKNFVNQPFTSLVSYLILQIILQMNQFLRNSVRKNHRTSTKLCLLDILYLLLSVGVGVFKRFGVTLEKTT